MFDSAECFYELFVRRLSDGERNAFWQEYLRFGELFGMPLDACPQTYSEFRGWWAQMLGGDGMCLTDEARYMGWASAFEIPLPAIRRPGKRIHDAIMLGSLPPRVRELYGVPYGPREQAQFNAGVRLLRGSRRLTPTVLARGSCVSQFEMVARTERNRIKRGTYTPQIRPGMFPSAAYTTPGSARSGEVEHDLAGRAA
jgi:uncharacterized protein (DUF2236 family)